MNPNHPSVKQRQHAVKEYLLEGFPISITAKHTGLSKKRVYDIANRDNLPFNRPVAPGSRTEKAIVELSFAGFTPDVIGEIHRMATPFVSSILERARARIVKEAHPRCIENAT